MNQIGLWFSLASAVVLCGCTQSLYVTEPTPLADEDGYIPVAPYFAEVRNTINVAIVPAPQPKDGTPQGSPTLTVSLIPVPVARGYLYLTRNALYNNTFNVSVGSDGLLSSSDTTSVQQVTAILTELAQTAAVFAAATAPGIPVAPPVAAALPNDDPAYCGAGVAKLTASIALYKSFDTISDSSATYPIVQTLVTGKTASKNVMLALQLTIPPGLPLKRATVANLHPGFVVFSPVPVVASIVCTVEGGTPLPLSQEMVLYPYFDSQYVDPKRDFLTEPAETFTLSEGFLTAHKYSDQSAAKTIVDTVTAPIRALFPSVSVQQTTQVQTGGGKPDQTTTTTQTTTGSPKTQ